MKPPTQSVIKQCTAVWLCTDAELDKQFQYEIQVDEAQVSVFTGQHVNLGMDNYIGRVRLLVEDKWTQAELLNFGRQLARAYLKKQILK